MKYLLPIRLICFFVVCTCVSSCSLFNKNLAKRYSNIGENIFNPAPDAADSYVEIRSYSSVLKDSPSPTPVYNLLSLSPEGQAQLIKSIDNNSKDLQEMIDKITSNFSFNKEQKQNIKIIGNTINKSLVFTVDRKVAVIVKKKNGNSEVVLNGKADRIDFLELEMNIDEKSKTSFNSWNQFVTKYATLDLGKVAQSQQFSASLNLNANAGSEISLAGNNTTENFNSDKQNGLVQIVGPSNGNTSTNSNAGEQLLTSKDASSSGSNSKITAGLGASGNLTYSDKYETSLDLRSRIIELSGSISEKKMVLRQESGPGLDLSGNVTVILNYALSDDWKIGRFIKFGSLYDKKSPTLLENLSNEYTTVVFPDLKGDVVGKLNYQFLYRQVNRGSRHIPEARQKVTYLYGQLGKAKTQPKDVVLVRPSEVRPFAHYITDTSGNQIQFKQKSLAFESVLEAENFLHYLGELLNSNKNTSKVTLNGVALNSSIYTNLTITSKML